MTWLTDPWHYAFFRHGIAAGTMAGALCGLVGVYVVLKRMSYIGHGLSTLCLVIGVVYSSFCPNQNWGAVVLTSSMVELLDADERAAVVAHERAHLRQRLTLFMEAINLLDHANVRFALPSVDRRTFRVTDLFEHMVPLIPSVGVLIEF